MGMSRHDAYYEPEDDYEVDQLQEEIYNLVAKDPKYDPADLSNLSEAIGQDCNNQELQQFIKDCVVAKDWAKLGLKLYQTSWDYQETCAEWHLTK